MISLFVAFQLLLATESPEAVLYPDHSRLLILRDAAGKETPVKTKEDWAKRREHILLGMQQAMGPLPPREDPPKIEG